MSVFNFFRRKRSSSEQETEQEKQSLSEAPSSKAKNYPSAQEQNGELPVSSINISDETKESTEKQIVDAGNEIDYVSLKNNETGHFSSNYVCAVKIDDGRYFIDYHFSENPSNYGTGKLFNHLWISGVTSDHGKYIQGGKDRLQLVELYDCNSEEEARSIFRAVLEHYKNKYGNLVLFNKNPLPRSKKLTEKRTIKSDVSYYEDDPFLVTYKGANTICRFETIQEFKAIQKEAQNPSLNAYMFVKEKGKKHRSEANYIKGSARYDGTAELTFVIPSAKNISSLTFSSDAGDYSWDKPYCSESDFDVYFRSVSVADDDFESCPPLKRQYSNCLRVLMGENLAIKINDDTEITFDPLIIRKLIVLLTVAVSNLLQSQSEYSKKCKSWIGSDSFSTLYDYEAERIARISPITVDKSTSTARISGSKGEIYETSLSGCNCMDFKRRNHDQIFFEPCKHMKWLAQKLGLTDFVILPEENPFSDDPIVELILNNRGHSFLGGCSFVPASVEGWKKPLLAFKETIWISDDSGGRFSLSLWLNRHNMIIDIDAPFYDGYGGNLYLDDKTRYIGKLFMDNGRTGYYKIDNSATIEIYKYIVAGKEFSIFLQMKYGDMKAYSIQIPESCGFANAYTNYFQDAIGDYREMEKIKRNPPRPVPFSKKYKLQ